MIMVWDMNKEEFTPLKKWMRWCPWIVTNSLKYSEDDWKEIV